MAARADQSLTDVHEEVRDLLARVKRNADDWAAALASGGRGDEITTFMETADRAKIQLDDLRVTPGLDAVAQDWYEPGYVLSTEVATTTTAIEAFLVEIDTKLPAITNLIELTGRRVIWRTFTAGQVASLIPLLQAVSATITV